VEGLKFNRWFTTKSHNDPIFGHQMLTLEWPFLKHPWNIHDMIINPSPGCVKQKVEGGNLCFVNMIIAIETIIQIITLLQTLHSDCFRDQQALHLPFLRFCNCKWTCWQKLANKRFWTMHLSCQLCFQSSSLRNNSNNLLHIVCSLVIVMIHKLTMLDAKSSQSQTDWIDLSCSIVCALHWKLQTFWEFVNVKLQAQKWCETKCTLRARLDQRHLIWSCLLLCSTKLLREESLQPKMTLVIFHFNCIIFETTHNVVEKRHSVPLCCHHSSSRTQAAVMSRSWQSCWVRSTVSFAIP